jgi:hypothetical protein
MSKLVPGFKKQWLEALRSGKYKQGRHALRRRDDTFCCLGVVCDLAAPEYWSWDPDIASDRFRHAGGNLGFPDDPMLARIGLTERAASELAWMNDRGATFAEIADYIQVNL